MTDDLKRYVNIGSDSNRWRLLSHRSGDVVISTPPKSGTTLTQRLCSLAIFGTAELPRPMDELSPWFDQHTRSDADALALVESYEHRRFLKTHTPLDGIPDWDDVIYITTARDPRDVFASWEAQLPNMDRDATMAAIESGVGIEAVSELLAPPLPTLDARIEQWLETDDLNAFSLARHLHHMEVSLQRSDFANVHIFHFDDLRNDQSAALRAISRALGSEMTPALADELAPAASFSAMKADADRLAPNTKGVFAEPAKFFRAGTSGGWRELLDDQSLDRYWERCRELASPELLDWVHRS